MKKVILAAFCLQIFVTHLSAQLYIAPDGDDDNSGTIDQPFGTFPKAILEAYAR